MTEVVVLGMVLLCPAAFGQASWYSEASVRREGNSGITASGEMFDDDALTAASWFHPFNTRLLVINRATGAWVVVRISDRGPSRRLVARGRIIDLSRAAFAKIAPLEQGICRVGILVVRRDVKHDSNRSHHRGPVKRGPVRGRL